MTEMLTDKDLLIWIFTTEKLILSYEYGTTETELFIGSYKQTDKEILSLSYDRGTTDAYSLIQITDMELLIRNLLQLSTDMELLYH